MIFTTPNALLPFLKKNDFQADIQEETQQVYIILKLLEREFPLFIRVFDEGHLLQLLAFIPCPLQEETVPDMARLLHLLNKELDVPGFGMDEMAAVVFYRIMIPTPKKKIEEDLLLAFIHTIEHVCKMFTGPIEAIAHKQMTLDEILEKAKEKEAES